MKHNTQPDECYAERTNNTDHHKIFKLGNLHNISLIFPNSPKIVLPAVDMGLCNCVGSIINACLACNKQKLTYTHWKMEATQSELITK